MTVLAFLQLVLQGRGALGEGCHYQDCRCRTSVVTCGHASRRDREIWPRVIGVQHSTSVNYFMLVLCGEANAALGAIAPSIAHAVMYGFWPSCSFTSELQIRSDPSLI